MVRLGAPIQEAQSIRLAPAFVRFSPPDIAIEHLFPPYTPEKVQQLNQWFGY
jgi:hypothetical protein